MRKSYARKSPGRGRAHPSVRFLLSLFLATIVCAFMISAQGFADKVFPADVAVVPGNEVFADGSLSPRLKGRVDAALGLYRHGMVKQIIVSGGAGKSGVNEADAMGAYLLAAGLPQEAVVIHREGVNTRATASFAGQYMRERGLERAIAVSQFFHLPRTCMALKHAGIAQVGSLHSGY